MRISVHTGQVALLHVGGENRGFVGQKEEAPDHEFFLRGKRQRQCVGGFTGVQVGADLFQQVRLQQGVFVSAFDLARNLLQSFADGIEIGQHQLGGNDLNIAQRIDASSDVDDVRVLKATHDLDERVHLPNVAE